jgi:hypothetical protein
MVTFIHNYVAVLRDEIFHCPFALQTLDYGNINQAGSLSFPSPILSDVSNRQR